MKRALILLLCLGLCGCATTPTAFPMKPGMIADFKINQSITIQNTGDSEVLKKWTAATIDFLSKELERKGATITSNSPIVLKVGVTRREQNAFYAYWAYKCYIFLKVETGKGYTKEFEINDVSGLSLQRACDFCITKAAAAILNDEKILNYLKQGSPSGQEGSEDSLNSNADEICKYKKLLDDGVITKEEFEQKKKQLLGL